MTLSSHKKCQMAGQTCARSSSARPVVPVPLGQPPSLSLEVKVNFKPETKRIKTDSQPPEDALDAANQLQILMGS